VLRRHTPSFSSRRVSSNGFFYPSIGVRCSAAWRSRERYLVALTVLRAQGGSSQQALACTFAMDGTNYLG